MFRNIQLLFVIALSTNACNPGPRPIDYGTDACYYCRMTIVDRQRASEIVTNKGKVYKFDAIECMVNSREALGDDNIARYLCNYFKNPGELTDATMATFLISDALPSPMGANLTAFQTKLAAQEVQEKLGGALYDWESLLIHLKSLTYGSRQ